MTTNYGSNTVSVLLGNGDGTFQAGQDFATGTNPKGVAIADFSGDGKQDIIVNNNGSNTVSLLLGNGDGTFQARQDFSVGSSPDGLAVGDFNEDGVRDLVTAASGANTVSVLLGNSTTTTSSGLAAIGGVSVATWAEALAAQGQVDGYLQTVNIVSGQIGSA